MDNDMIATNELLEAEQAAGIQVVMTMAGRGTRMADVSARPKPLIDVRGRPMYHWALQTLDKIPFAQLYLVVSEDYRADFGAEAQLFTGLPVEFVYQSTEPCGQLCSALEARQYFAPERPVLILGADTLVETKLAAVAKAKPQLDGIISVADVPPGDDRWSFAEVDVNGLVRHVREKERISDLGCTGAYYFRSAELFVRVADKAIADGASVNGEFYVCPLYQRLIDGGRAVGISRDQMYDMGTPDALSNFIANPPAKIDLISTLTANAIDPVD
jgi:dTDP-glucose pyrophosphorylase